MRSRITVFAHYDKDGLVDDYVVYYLQSLKKICDKVVFVSCVAIEDLSKLEGVADVCITEQHDEYDFGSYKRGFVKAKELGWLDSAEELIFANDSCYGPFQDFEPIFESMNDCDFWGLTRNKFGYKKSCLGFYIASRPHIQSYFLTFKRNVFMSEVFQKFIFSIAKMDSKKDIIENYEIGLSEKLINAGFKGDSYIKDYYRINNAPILKWRNLLLNHNMPLIKCSLLRLGNIRQTTITGWKEIILKLSNYPVNFIENNLERTRNRELVKCSLPLNVKKVYFNIISELPFALRKIAGMIIVRVPFLHD